MICGKNLRLNKKFIQLLGFIFLFSISIFPQNYFVRNYSSENGIASRNIYSVVQDNDGLMWFATGAGVSSYDGFQWINYGPKDGLKESSYKAIIYDEKGVLWSAPQYLESGIFKYNKGKWESFKTPPLATSGRMEVTSFSVLYNGEEPVFGVGTTTGLYIFYANNWHYYNNNKDGNAEYINCLSANNNAFYAGTVDGILGVDVNGNKIEFPYNSMLPDKVIRGISYINPDSNNPKGTFFILGVNWLIKIKGGLKEEIFKNTSIPWDANWGASYLVYDNKTIVYFGNRMIKYSCNLGSSRLKPLLKKNGFTSNGATDIFIDRENNVWITDLRGIDKITNLNVNNYFETSGLLEDEVTSVIEYEKGGMLFGHNNGLTYLKNNIFHTIPFPNSNDIQMILSRIQNMAKDNNGNVWIASSRRGFCKWNPGKGFKWLEENPGENFLSTQCDGDGNIWVLSDKAFYSVKDNKLVKVLTHSFEYGYLRKLFCFKDDKSVYFVGGSGAYRYFHNNLEKLFTTNKTSELNCYSLFKTGDKEFLLGTDSGVYSVKDNKIVRFNINNETISDPVYFITKDTKGNIWFGTDNGVIISVMGKKLQKLSVDYGLAGRETNRDAGLVDSYGRMWVGTDKGVSCFINDFQGINIPVPSIILLEGECLDGTRFSLNENVNLKSSQNTLAFNFRGVSFVNEDSIKYLVKLKGYDNEWQFLEQHELGEVRYKNLPPGDYQLDVKTRNSQGEWSIVKESGIITIVSPLYVRWWFIAIIIAIIGSFLFYRKLEKKYYHTLETAVKDRTKELEENRNILEKRVEERTIQLAMLNARKNKFFSIIAHDLKSPFQALMGFNSMLLNQRDEIPKNELDELINLMSSTVHRLYAMLDNLLTWARLQMNQIDFSPTRIDLFSLVKEISFILTANAQKKGVRIEINIVEGTEIIADENMIKSILQNLVNNGIKFTPSGGCINISSISSEKEVMITVEDNGVGMNKDKAESIFKIDVSATTKGTDGEIGTGMGLLICKEMAEMHGGDIIVKSVEGKGSTFTVKLPQ